MAAEQELGKEDVLLGQAFGRLLQPGGDDRQRVLGLAGLFHDIGELYIDPVYLRRSSPLGAQEWKHIVIHPLVADRVMRHIAGRDAAVADAVLHHHERLDGFGYPHGVSGAQLPLSGQIVAAAEWLMGLLDSGLTPDTRASIAIRMIPGEFNERLLEAVRRACAPGDTDQWQNIESSIDGIEPSLTRVADALRRFKASLGWIDGHMGAASPALKAVLESCVARLWRLQTAFSSVGLDAQDTPVLLSTLRSTGDKTVGLELVTVVRELEWRLNELDREFRLRCGTLSGTERLIAEETARRLWGDKLT